MPSNKDLKRLVRARMAKTGETYTTARACITRKKLTLPAGYQKLARMSDEAVAAKTGRTWREWTAVLDDLGATEMSHRDIARWVSTNHDFGGWWSQTVTVGYERIRGLRDIGQGRDGTYRAGKTRTLPFGEAEVRRVLDDDSARTRWLGRHDVTPRAGRRSGAFRLSFPDGSKAEIRLTAKGAARTQVSVEHGGLESADDASTRKELWSERLAALGAMLADGTR
jgi:hypothetical protein